MVSQPFLASYAAARNGAAMLRREERAWIVVSGNDRRSYLQGLLTNEIAALGPGQGCYAAYLTPQGRMITDLYVYELGDVLLLGMSERVKQTVLTKLDQFIFSEDVQLGDVSASFATISLLGPKALEAVAQVVDIDTGAVAAAGRFGNARGRFNGEPAILVSTDAYGVPDFDLLVDTGHVAALIEELSKCGVEEIADEVAEALRIEAGIPLFGRDMNEETIPLEAGLEQRAISFSKGCYVGQEVVIRILHRGHGRVVKKLVGLTIAGAEVPSRGATIGVAERTIGEVTSSTWSPLLDRPIALGYVHRDFVAPATSVRIGEHSATVVALPFHQQPD